MNAILTIIFLVLDILQWVIIASVIMSWLFHFGIINYSSPVIKMIYDTIYQITEPMFAFVRRFLPNLGGLDIAPVIILLAIVFLKVFIAEDLLPMMRGTPG